MKNPWIYIGTLLVLVLVLPALSGQGEAAPLAQFTPFPTPTPGQDGRIIYIAEPGDSAWRIAAIFGLSMEELRALNKWGVESPTIIAGDSIILGFSSIIQATPTMGPSPTAGPLLPTPSREPGWGQLCIILYNDLNGDSLRQESEPSLPGGAFSVSSRDGTFSKTAETKPGDEHECHENIPEGTFNITVAIPDGYNPTTELNYSLRIQAGETHYVDFGAQANSETVAEQPGPVGEGNSPIFGLIGGALLIAAVGLALFGGRLLRVK
jgi:hypothetical protein